MIIEITRQNGNYTRLSGDFYMKYDDFMLVFTSSEMNYIEKYDLGEVKIDGVIIQWRDV